MDSDLITLGADACVQSWASSAKRSCTNIICLRNTQILPFRRPASALPHPPTGGAPYTAGVLRFKRYTVFGGAWPEMGLKMEKT